MSDHWGLLHTHRFHLLLLHEFSFLFFFFIFLSFFFFFWWDWGLISQPHIQEVQEFSCSQSHVECGWSLLPINSLFHVHRASLPLDFYSMQVPDGFLHHSSVEILLARIQQSLFLHSEFHSHIPKGHGLHSWLLECSAVPHLLQGSVVTEQWELNHKTTHTY
jgi:hypothetical protein